MNKQEESIIKIKYILKYEHGIELSKYDEETLKKLPPSEAKKYLRKILEPYMNGYVKVCPIQTQTSTLTSTPIQINQSIIIKKTFIPYENLSFIDKIRYNCGYYNKKK